MSLPLLIELHGAGKNRFWSLEESVGRWEPVARRHNMLILYPEAKGSTWDFISSRRSARSDVDFMEAALNHVRKTFNVDNRRIAVIGISDGGSMALSLATHNPKTFQAAISISAGFCASPPLCSGKSPKLFMKHGAEDRMFPVSRVAIPLRDQLKAAGYSVEHRVGAGDGHVPRGWEEEFLSAWLALPVE